MVLEDNSVGGGYSGLWIGLCTLSKIEKQNWKLLFLNHAFQFFFNEKLCCPIV